MENKKFIVFDFFGVICSEIAPYWFERYFPTEEAVKLKHTYLRPADAGKISSEELFQNLATLVKTTPDQVEADWFSLVTMDNDVVSLLRRARNHHTVVLCSNALSPFIRRILYEHDLETLFDTIIISSEIGVAKPDLGFFTKTLEILKATPEEVLFVDDNPHNVAAAEQLGIESLVFTGIKSIAALSR